ncbi:MAG: NAD-dependent DNA ligase LigA, partial [Bacteroidales bacterium]|nr:NAD-dependent DNA ligase LigA [Bacteroidales bacterium]
EVIADSILQWFADASNCEIIERLRKVGLHLAMQEQAGPSSAALAGKVIVISGTYSISRDEMKALIERHGGKISSSVSAKTSWLLAGEKAGPEKRKKAESLGIPLLSEEQLRAMLNEIPGQAGNDSDEAGKNGQVTPEAIGRLNDENKEETQEGTQLTLF